MRPAPLGIVPAEPILFSIYTPKGPPFSSPHLPIPSLSPQWILEPGLNRTMHKQPWSRLARTQARPRATCMIYFFLSFFSVTIAHGYSLLDGHFWRLDPTIDKRYPVASCARAREGGLIDFLSWKSGGKSRMSSRDKDGAREIYPGITRE